MCFPAKKTRAREWQYNDRKHVHACHKRMQKLATAPLVPQGMTMPPPQVGTIHILLRGVDFGERRGGNMEIKNYKISLVVPD